MPVKALSVFMRESIEVYLSFSFPGVFTALIGPNLPRDRPKAVPAQGCPRAQHPSGQLSQTPHQPAAVPKAPGAERQRSRRRPGAGVRRGRARQPRPEDGLCVGSTPPWPQRCGNVPEQGRSQTVPWRHTERRAAERSLRHGESFQLLVCT